MPNPAVPARPGTTRRAMPSPATEPALAVVLTCTDCERTYEPTTEDFAAGRTGCPDRDCGGWTYTAALTAPATGGAR